MLTPRSGPIAKQKPPDLRLVAWEFFCKVCANEFEADWAPDQNVVCSRCGKPTRIGHRTLDNGRRVRVCRHCGEQLEVKS